MYFLNSNTIHIRKLKTCFSTCTDIIFNFVSVLPHTLTAYLFITFTVNYENQVGSVGFVSVLFPKLLPLGLIKVDHVTGVEIRGPDGLCQRCLPVRIFDARALNGHQVSGTLFLFLIKFGFLLWDLFTKWSEFGVRTTTTCQFVTRSHGRNSNFSKTRKKGSTSGIPW